MHTQKMPRNRPRDLRNVRLVVDEVGYLTYGPDAANVLFHVVNDRHIRRRPMVFTTNKSPITGWGDVLHDHDLAEAIVDRVLERGRLIVMDGPSYRTRHLDGLEPLRSDPPARVSGIEPPEFPEPALIPLSDLSTESGRSIQQGYHSIFAGAVQAARNPAAHAVLEMDRGEAVHLIYLASLLMTTYDKRPRPSA